MERVLVSACLLGRPVRYDGTDNAVEDEVLRRWREEGRVVPICPEMEGGLGTPRPPSEIVPVGETEKGGEVLDGRARVVTDEGDDVTDAYLDGARAALALVREHEIRVAVLKDGSPSCGTSYVYDGSFEGRAISGRGVTAAMLQRRGVEVFSEDELPAARRALAALGTTPSE
ncbi:MAG: DUF523 domain-containing protein [Bradymonadaceae bacterium]